MRELVDRVGVEPTCSRLKGERSAAEPPVCPGWQPSFAIAPEGIQLRAKRRVRPAKRVSAKQDGSDGRLRTCNLLGNSEALCRLSYVGTSLVPPERIELPTFALRGRCSAV